MEVKVFDELEDQYPGTEELGFLQLYSYAELPRRGDYVHLNFGRRSYGRVVRNVVWHYQGHHLDRVELVVGCKL